MKLKFESKISKYLILSIFILFLYLEISYFYIFTCILFITNLYKIIDKEKIFYLVSVFTFYFLRFVFSLSSSFDRNWDSFSLYNFSYANTRFFDLQQNLVSMKCIITNVDKYYYKFSTTSYISCPYSAKYGPLSTKIPFLGDIWIATLILSFAAIVSILYLYKYVVDRNENYFFITILFLSPATNFLIERMNIDIFIFLVSIYCLINYKKYPRLGTFFILILSLYKLHPFGLLVGLTFYFVIKKDKKLFQMNFNAIILFFVVYLLDSIYYMDVLATEWRPADLRTTFGLLSDSLILDKILGVGVNTVYIFLIVIILLLALTLNRLKLFSNFQLDEVEELIFYSFAFLICLNFMYANYDYRIALFLPISYIFYKKLESTKIVHLFIFLLPIGLKITNRNPELIYIDNFFAIIGRISIYVFISCILLIIFYEIKAYRFKNIYKFVTQNE